MWTGRWPCPGPCSSSARPCRAAPRFVCPTPPQPITLCGRRPSGTAGRTPRTGSDAKHLHGGCDQHHNSSWGSHEMPPLPMRRRGECLLWSRPDAPGQPTRGGNLMPYVERLDEGDIESYETYEMFRVVCPDCAQPIALLADEDVLPEHALCPSPWNPF